MAENKEYFTQEMENGSIQISEDVVASVTGMAVLEVEGVCGLSSSIGTDIAEMLGMKTLSKGVRLSTTETGALRIDCDVVSKFGQNIFELAKNVQEKCQVQRRVRHGLARCRGQCDRLRHCPAEGQ